ncbi:MAG TPA: FtsX-like permease family protein [Lacunisphaera sp.]|jgi:lipoprotein-releasing system permease protein|nr:FtsX-like permease family protein [Lacunisphaera sp.]
MSPTLRIAFRFLTAKKRAMLMSLSCIILGVGLFIVTQATTSGFEDFFIKTILGTNGAIRVEDRIQDTIRSMEAAGGGSGSMFQIAQKEAVKYIEGVEEPKLVMDALREFRNVTGLSEVLTGPAVLRSSFKSDSVKVYGIVLENHIMVSELANQIVQGDLENFRNTPAGALVGKVIADRLQLNVGDSFILDSAGQSRRYRVAAVYETGVSDIDKERVYLALNEARSLLKKPTGASFIQVSLRDKDRAVEDAAAMQEVVKHGAASWQVREKTWLGVFAALRISSGITVSVFTLIAGLAMFNTLAMIVLEKTKEIAILRSMGYTREDISAIFVWQAVIVLFIGIVLGCSLGAGITYAVSKYPIHIRGIFATDHFLVDLSPWHFVWASVTAIVMVVVASLVPARRAARFEPGDIIRGTAQ